MKSTLILLGLLGCIVTSSLAISISTGTKSVITLNTDSSASASDSASDSASYPLSSFKPQTQKKGPYGGSQGTSFTFEQFDFAQYLATLTVTADNNGLTSLQASYESDLQWLITDLLPEAIRPTYSSDLVGTKVGTTSEWKRSDGGYIVKASVCTGTVGGTTVVTALRFVTDQGETTTFGSYGRSNTKCTSATPSASGYYLSYLSGRAGSRINQLTLHWKSDFSQERACIFDAKCLVPTDLCYIEGGQSCCLKKVAGEAVGSISCTA